MKPDKEQRIRKTGKGKFEMLEIIDEKKNKEKNGNSSHLKLRLLTNAFVKSIFSFISF